MQEGVWLNLIELILFFIIKLKIKLNITKNLILRILSCKIKTCMANYSNFVALTYIILYIEMI